jgi:tetratricopeptide (TPR) repeat protein
MRSFLTSAALVAFLVSPVRAEPRPMVETAKKELDRARALFEVGDYKGAIAALDAGFAIDPHPDFLYAKGQAQRKLGDCPGALASFRAFLASDPPGRAAEAARTNIERCQEAAPEPKPAVPSRPADGTDVTAAATTDRKPHAPSPWYRDGIGGALAGGSAVALGIGITFLVLADRHVDRTLDADGLEDYDSERSLVTRNRTIGAVSLAAAGALAGAAIFRYATRPGPREPSVRPTGELGPEGAILGVAGEF